MLFLPAFLEGRCFSVFFFLPFHLMKLSVFFTNYFILIKYFDCLKPTDVWRLVLPYDLSFPVENLPG